MDPKILRSRVPFGELPEALVDNLAGSVHVEMASRGECVLERGSEDARSVYLLHGLVELEAGDGRTLTVDGASTRARQPLSRLTPHKFRIVALSDISYFRVDNEAIAQMFAPVGQENFLLEEQQVSGVEAGETLFRRLFRDLASDGLVLPILPSVAERIQTLLKEEKPSGARLRDVILKDPTLTASVLKIGCKIVPGSDRPGFSLTDLVDGMGASTTRRALQRILSSQVFKPKSALLTQRLTSIWRHSHQVAAIAAVLAGKAEGISIDKAIVVGLLHDIGAIAILGYGELEAEQLEPGELDSALLQLRAPVGALILKTWGCDSDLAAAAEHARDWPLANDAGSLYVDLAWVARLYADIDTGDSAQMSALDDLEVFSRLGLRRPERTGIREVLYEANVRLKEMSASMRAA
jgi:HD-like signal output (HDOD) protein